MQPPVPRSGAGGPRVRVKSLGEAVMLTQQRLHLVELTGLLSHVSVRVCDGDSAARLGHRI